VDPLFAPYPVCQRRAGQKHSTSRSQHWRDRWKVTKNRCSSSSRTRRTNAGCLPGRDPQRGGSGHSASTPGRIRTVDTQGGWTDLGRQSVSPECLRRGASQLGSKYRPLEGGPSVPIARPASDQSCRRHERRETQAMRTGRHIGSKPSPKLRQAGSINLQLKPESILIRRKVSASTLHRNGLVQQMTSRPSPPDGIGQALPAQKACAMPVASRPTDPALTLERTWQGDLCTSD